MIAWIMAIALGCTCCDVSSTGVSEFSAETASNAAYDALNPKGRRKSPSAATQHEDRHLGQEQRRQLIGGIRDLNRNYPLPGWMIRQHLNYVCSHRLQMRLGKENKNAGNEIEAALKEEFVANKIDERETLDLDEYVETSETMAVLDGDCGTLVVDADGGRIQGIEGDRIRDPNGASYLAGVSQKPSEYYWYNGVRTTKSGRPVEYAIHRRVNGWTMFELERLIPKSNFHLHAYRTRFDQARGVSPITAAYNQLRDLYESEELSMVRSKVDGLFAMAIQRKATQASGDLSFETDENGDPIKSSYQVDFGRGPFVLDLDPGDDAKFLDSSNPSSNLQNFWRFATMVALKSLDMPYGLFDESVSNFFGNKTAWLSYERSCVRKRARVQKLLDFITFFKLRCLIRDKRITLPRGTTLGSKRWVWVPRGMPWWRPLEEVTANLKAIGGGLATPQRVCIEGDQGDFFDNVDDIAEAIEYAESKGVHLSFAVDEDLAKQLADKANKPAADKGA